MPGTLTHSTADIIRQLLIDIGQGASINGTWPVFAAREPDTPDNCITVYDTPGRDQGRTMSEGQRQERHGVQVRIRSDTHASGWAKARAIAVALDEQVYQECVTIDGTVYLIHSFSRKGDVMSLGHEGVKKATSRSIFTVNGTVSLRQVES